MRINKFAAIGVAGAIGAASFGIYSTTLTMTDESSFSAGSTPIAVGCIASLTTKAATPVLTAGVWKISSVTLTGNFTGCAGASVITVDALDASNAVLASNTITVTAIGVSSGVVSLTSFNSENLSKFAVMVNA